MVPTGIISPEDLAILAGVVDDYCRAFNIRPASPEGQEAAQRAILLFETGCSDPTELRARLAAFEKSGWPQPTGQNSGLE
ncbi:hypothetical protein [Mesorhizobium sp. WSM3868]|uniref:hypothetical protein n=1 Tax=Mesorhizobium sp. WSM3868 TaxID=2029405 RepID=UPI000BD38542|nr:hypothetical protein [Mesorhizobium sp. WSM3868]PBB39630.1 hypothetical protein CK221_02070 [Mesorhizobium sp. WSM3868]